MLGTVVNAKAIISLAAKTSHNLNSTFNFSFCIDTFPVINACAFIRVQSSNLGFKCAMSGFCKKAPLLSVLNKPVFLKLFSITLEISIPKSSNSKSFVNSLLSFFSNDNGETAIGKGSKFPLVISTSIKE